ncbi:MAG: SPOR domain-containing protein [Burkholderiales bacterium]
MSRDYKRTDRPRGGRRNGSSLLVGILIGLVLGLGVALGVAWYINKMPNPFATRITSPPKADVHKTVPQQSPRAEEKKAKVEEAKPRFDFYKILPGAEEPVPEKQAKDKQGGSTSGGKETFMLQAGAFQNALDADNLKARLALLGFEATIETSAVPDKGTWHRVRMGPYTSVEELNRTRETLKQNGVQTTLIKLREPER